MAATSRPLRLILVSAIFSAAYLAACGSPNDADLPFPGSEDGTSGGIPSGDGGPGPLGDGGSSNDGSTNTPDGSTADSGSDAGVVSAFTGAGAYQDTTGNSSRKGDHDFAGNTPTTNPAKQACLSCHSQGGGAPRFLFGGTVYADVNGQTPASNIEVAVRDSAGNSVIVRTDQDGNFYRKPGGGDPTFPAQTGARNGAVVRLMNAAVSASGGGDCNGCHKAGAAGVIHVP